MSLLFNTLQEFDDEIAFVRSQMRNAVTAEEFTLNTSQSNQKVRMNFSEVRKYLNQLTAQRTALAQRLFGVSVTGITVRRNF